jgi:hypothetical protein
MLTGLVFLTIEVKNSKIRYILGQRVKDLMKEIMELLKSLKYYLYLKAVKIKLKK